MKTRAPLEHMHCVLGLSHLNWMMLFGILLAVLMSVLDGACKRSEGYPDDCVVSLCFLLLRDGWHYPWLFSGIWIVIRGDEECASSSPSVAGRRKIFLNLRIPIIFFSSAPSLLHCVLLNHFILTCFHSCVWANIIRAGREHGQLGFLGRNKKSQPRRA